MPALRFQVPVAASAEEVVARLEEAGDQPRQLVSWFTDDQGVDATVGRSPGGWRVRVVGGVFTADVEVAVAPRPVGSVIGVDGQLAGRGLFGLASGALRLAGPRIEAEARRTLQREFGAPAQP